MNVTESNGILILSVGNNSYTLFSFFSSSSSLLKKNENLCDFLLKSHAKSSSFNIINVNTRMQKEERERKMKEEEKKGAQRVQVKSTLDM